VAWETLSQPSWMSDLLLEAEIPGIAGVAPSRVASRAIRIRKPQILNPNPPVAIKRSIEIDSRVLRIGKPLILNPNPRKL
jgi:hypothetical protein